MASHDPGLVEVFYGAYVAGPTLMWGAIWVIQCQAGHFYPFDWNAKKFWNGCCELPLMFLTIFFLFSNRKTKPDDIVCWTHFYFIATITLTCGIIVTATFQILLLLMLGFSGPIVLIGLVHMTTPLMLLKWWRRFLFLVHGWIFLPLLLFIKIKNSDYTSKLSDKRWKQRRQQKGY